MLVYVGHVNKNLLASFFNLVLWSLEVAGSFDFHDKACVYDFLCVRLNEPFLSQMYGK